MRRTPDLKTSCTPEKKHLPSSIAMFCPNLSVYKVYINVYTDVSITPGVIGCVQVGGKYCVRLLWLQGRTVRHTQLFLSLIVNFGDNAMLLFINSDKKEVGRIF